MSQSRDPYRLRRIAETTIVPGSPATLVDGIAIPARRWRGGTYRYVDELPEDLRPERDTRDARRAYRSIRRETARGDRHEARRPGWYNRRAQAYAETAALSRATEEPRP